MSALMRDFSANVLQYHTVSGILGCGGLTANVLQYHMVSGILGCGGLTVKP